MEEDDTAHGTDIVAVSGVTFDPSVISSPCSFDVGISGRPRGGMIIVGSKLAGGII